MSAVSLVSLSTVPTGFLRWRRGGHEVLTVVTKATFALKPGETILAAEQEPLSAIERAYPAGSSRGVYAPADMVPMKPHADVVLVGHAFARDRKPARSFSVRLAIGDIDKRAEVFCDRTFDQQGNLHEGAPVASVPLVMERSAGGPETENPLGLRADHHDTYGRLAVPNVQPVGLHVATPNDTFAPVIFGPIASSWPARQALLGASLQGRAPSEWDGQVLPPDLDPSCFNAAPRDQQTRALTGEEPIRLENLNEAHPEMTMRLPGLRPKAFIEGLAADAQPLAMRADTLWIDTSRALCTLTWRGQVALPAGASVTALVAMELAFHPMSWEQVDKKRRALEGKGEAPRGHLDETAHDAPAVPMTLPFQQSAASASPAAPSARPQSGAALPFQGAGGPAAPLPRPPPPSGRAASTMAMPAMTDPTVAAPPQPVQPALAQAPSIAPPSYAPPLSYTPLPAPAPAAVPVPAPPAAPAPATAPAPAAVSAPREALTLVGHDPACLSRLRKDPRFRPLLDALDHQPLDADLDAAADHDATEDVEDRREVLEILVRAGATAEEKLAALLAAATQPDGRVIPPLCLIAAEIALPFDEVDELRATVTAATPHVGDDTGSRAILALAKQFLAAPSIAGLGSVAEGLSTRLRETLEKKGLASPGTLAAQAERALLAKRSRQRRVVFGGSFVRALLRGEPTKQPAAPIPMYVPDEIAAKLPAAARVRVRAIAAVHPAIDPADAHPLALRAVAIAIATPVTMGDPAMTKSVLEKK